MASLGLEHVLFLAGAFVTNATPRSSILTSTMQNFKYISSQVICFQFRWRIKTSYEKFSTTWPLSQLDENILAAKRTDQASSWHSWRGWSLDGCIKVSFQPLPITLHWWFLMYFPLQMKDLLELSSMTIIQQGKGQDQGGPRYTRTGRAALGQMLLSWIFLVAMPKEDLEGKNF